MAFRARYSGPCAADCGDRITIGDEVTYVADELVHLECSSEEPKTETKACTKCWLVHNGECF